MAKITQQIQKELDHVMFNLDKLMDLIPERKEINTAYNVYKKAHKNDNGFNAIDPKKATLAELAELNDDTVNVELESYLVLARPTYQHHLDQLITYLENGNIKEGSYVSKLGNTLAQIMIQRQPNVDSDCLTTSIVTTKEIVGAARYAAYSKMLSLFNDDLRSLLPVFEENINAIKGTLTVVGMNQIYLTDDVIGVVIDNFAPSYELKRIQAGYQYDTDRDMRLRLASMCIGGTQPINVGYRNSTMQGQHPLFIADLPSRNTPSAIYTDVFGRYIKSYLIKTEISDIVRLYETGRYDNDVKVRDSVKQNMENVIITILDKLDSLRDTLVEGWSDNEKCQSVPMYQQVYLDVSYRTEFLKNKQHKRDMAQRIGEWVTIQLNKKLTDEYKLSSNDTSKLIKLTMGVI